VGNFNQIEQLAKLKKILVQTNNTLEACNEAKL